MNRTLVVALLLVACTRKDPSKLEAPVSCAPGQVISAQGCETVVTPATVDAVGKQASRLDELAALLANAEVVTGPVALLDGFRQTETWKTFAKGSAKLQLADEIVAALGTASKELVAFQGKLKTSSHELTDLKTQLNTLLTTPAVAQRLETLQHDVTSKVTAAVAPLVAQLDGLAKQGLGPLSEKLTDVSDVVTAACVFAKSSGGEQIKSLCEQARTVFGQATQFLAGVKDQPVALVGELASALQTTLGKAIDSEGEKLLKDAQDHVNSLLKLPAAP